MSCCGAFAMPIDLPAPQSPPQHPFKVSGRMVLFAMVAFFAVVAGVNAVMMTVAIRTMPGVDVRSAYEASQRFNGEIARMQAQTERGWRAQARVSRAGNDAVVTLILREQAGAPVTGLSVEARLQHPASRQVDRQAVLVETGPGIYVATVTSVHRGAWTLAVEARRGNEMQFVSRSRVMLAD
jgi:nitrogen fixation protein FixH